MRKKNPEAELQGRVYFGRTTNSMANYPVIYIFNIEVNEAVAVNMIMHNSL